MRLVTKLWRVAWALVALAASARAAESAPARVVCVFGGGSDAIDPKYLAAATQLGEGLGERGWTLLFGGGKSGLMGAVARGVKSRGGRVVSVRVEGVESAAGMFAAVDEAVWVRTIAERKELFQRRAAAVIALPGGAGTLDELSGAIERAQVQAPPKPIVIFNQDGYYDGLRAFLDHAITERFARESLRSRLVFASTLPAVFAQLEPTP